MKRVIRINTKHELYNEYVHGRINGIVNGILEITTDGNARHYGSCRKPNEKYLNMTIECTDDQYVLIKYVLKKHYSSMPIIGLLKFE